ncbi:hypothetical protein AMJ44_11700 [candidate division WOR-1 bacterium DG_54_3]|uniref:DUF5723 domain-containing protein n=1 Tax=candidate division WOR-1 bacterium DG_54_3 TaxID=1703775 RepID=A0A0S7XR33_UNCSA|nr:MAG: hypothetical protein AMJ44_11700 [candidate division WOR-1 bacterium DG_54_3]
MNKFKIQNSKLKMKVILIMMVSLLAVTIAEAGTSLDLGVAGVGARPLGMGKAYVAVADDANAVFANPAGLGLQKTWSLTSMSTKLLNTANYTLAGSVIPLDAGTIGIGYIGLNSPAGYLVDENNKIDDSLSYNSSEIILSYARNLKDIMHGSNLGNLSVGASYKFINHKFDGFDGSAQGTSLDLGVIYKPNENLSLGANIVNIAGKIKWDSGKEEEVESTNKLGGALKLMEGKLLASAGLDFSINSERPLLLHGGLEYRPLNFLSIRGGIDQDPIEKYETQTNFTMGIGLNFDGVSFDYAYHQDKNIESNARHYFSISIQAPTSKVMARESRDSLVADASAQPKKDNQFTTASETKEDDESVLEYNRKILSYYE